MKKKNITKNSDVFIGVLDYGIGNVGSICNMLKKLNISSERITVPSDLNKCTKIILPGVGSFDSGILALKDSGMLQELNEQVLIKKKPILGICLGMQLFAQQSEEGKEKGLGWINGRVSKFCFLESKIKVPHMGWNYVKFLNEKYNIDDDEKRFYFVHSYYLKIKNKNKILCTSNYGSCEFVSGIIDENIIGVQFHPEKSHKYGFQFLNYFANDFGSEFV